MHITKCSQRTDGIEKQAIRKYLTPVLHLDFTAALYLTRESLWMDVTLKNKARAPPPPLAFYFCLILTPEVAPSSEKCKIAGLSKDSKEITCGRKWGVKHSCFLSRCNPKSQLGCVCFQNCY